MQTKQWTETNVSWDYVGVLNLETIIPSTNSVIFFSQIQYCAKEMQTKFAEISEITRISAINANCELSLQTKKRRNFGASIVLMSAKFRKARRLIETKFRGIRRNFVSVGRNFVSLERSFASTKRNFVSAKRNIVWTRRNFASTKRNFVFQEFVADYRITVIITSCKSTGTWKRDHYWKKKHRNDCYNCGEVLRQNRVFWLETFFYFFLNIILF